MESRWAYDWHNSLNTLTLTSHERRWTYITNGAVFVETWKHFIHNWWVVGVAVLITIELICFIVGIELTPNWVRTQHRLRHNFVVKAGESKNKRR